MARLTHKLKMKYLLPLLVKARQRKRELMKLTDPPVSETLAFRGDPFVILSKK